MSLITPDFGLLFWMTLIFAILFFLLAKFGFPIITGMVEKRSERIEKSIAEAHAAEERLSNLEQEQRKVIENARLEQGRILEEAGIAKDNIISDAKARAKEEAQKIVDEGRKQALTERENAMRDLRSKIALVSVAIAGKVVRHELIPDSEQEKLIDALSKEAESEIKA